MWVVYWLLVAVAAAICAIFAIANRPPVSLDLWPLPFVVALPLYLLVFAALLTGFVVGALAAWIRARHRRRELRRDRRRITALENELAQLRARLGDPPAGTPVARQQSRQTL
jgi:lipopolysaccharide assembly protein A